MTLTNILSFISVLLLITSCNINSENDKSTVPEEKLFSFGQEDEVYEIINSTLKVLAPQPTNSESTILVNEKLLVADKALIDDFIAKGANELLAEIDRKQTNAKKINIRLVNDYDKIKILHTYPLTNNELKRHVGGAIYSRIILNDDKTKASFIFNFERLH